MSEQETQVQEPVSYTQADLQELRKRTLQENAWQAYEVEQRQQDAWKFQLATVLAVLLVEAFMVGFFVVIWEIVK